MEVKDSEIINIKKEEYLTYNYNNPPEIITFINYLKNKGIDIDYYKDPKDLLKAIYRLIGG